MRLFKHIFFLLLISLGAIFCQKQAHQEHVLTVVSDTDKNNKIDQITNISLETGNKSGISIDSYLHTTVIYSAYYNAFGYYSDRNTFTFTDLRGKKLFTLNLPWPLIMITIDDANHWLIGLSMENVIKLTVIDLDRQSILLQKALDTAYSFPLCSYVYNAADSIYYTFAEDKNGNSFILGIKVTNGNIISKTKTETTLRQTVYNSTANTIIGLSCNEDDYLTLTTINPVTGQVISSVPTELKTNNLCLSCFTYDTKHYITVKKQDNNYEEIIFIDPATGQTVQRLNATNGIKQLIYHSK